MGAVAKEWDEGWPDWRDSGRRVEIELDDGQVVSGKLWADDVGFSGEDEYPIFVVEEADGGTRHSFANARCWRFSDSPVKG